MDPIGQPRHKLICALVCLGLSAAVLLTYWPVTHYEFVNFDDLGYVIQNRNIQTGFTWENLRWAFTSFYAGNWHPVTWLSHALDWQLFGLKSGGHHLTNLILHTANTLLLFWLLLRMVEAETSNPNLRSSSNPIFRSSIIPAFLIAALFGLHPMHVESVAWIAERKDVLSAFFFLLTLLAYVAYAKRSQFTVQSSARASAPRSTLHAPRIFFYLLALTFFALGLMSKPMLVTTPFVLLLLDFWPLGRVTSPTGNGQRPNLSHALPSHAPALLRLFAEKLPFFALSAADCVLTFLAQRQTGAVASSIAAPLETRVCNSIVSYAAYLEKAFWPGHMAVYYPFREQPEFLPVAAGILVLLIGTVIALRSIRTRPYLTFGWFWFVGTLVPVIGLLQVGLQAMADRYTYIPYIGLFIAIVWFIAGARFKVQDESSQPIPRFSVLNSPFSLSIAVLLLAACAFSASHQVRFWQNSETLWRQAVRVTSGNVVARQNLGSALVEQRRFEEGALEFQEALKIKPMYAEAESNYGFALYMLGRMDEALEHYRRAVQMKPIGRAHYLIAMVLNAQGKHAEAAAEYKQAIELEPELPPALNDLAWILAADPDPALRNGPQAVVYAERACQNTLVPNPLFIGTLAAAYAEAGRFPDAIAAGERARELATKLGNTALAQRNEELLQLYRSGKPCHEPAATTTAERK